MTTNRGLIYGRITDYPDVAERRLHVDCGRKYISKDWFIREIREMSYLKMNALQIHFSENFGFRIECETDPAIMSEEYLTKAEVREILAEAEEYGVKVIPSFDSPGHVDQILKAHPEYGQISTDGREQHSFDVLNQEKNIYETWMPGKFQENTINDDHEAIRGASVAVWCDQADVCTEDVIASDIGPALRSLAGKSWNTESSSRLDYTGFQALTETLGYPVGYEKGSVLPEVGEFTEAEAVARVWLRCVDEAGHMIQEDQISYGEKGSSYEITAPKGPSMRAVTGAQSGIYTEEEVTLTFVYEPDPDAEMRDSGDLTYPSVQEYVTGGGEFVLSENLRFIIEGAEGREAEQLIQDLQLLSSEFAAKGLVEQRMEILQGADVKALPGDILIRLEEEEDADPEAYEIQILGYARVSASHERGIFYGIRTIEKGLLLNDKTMEWGRIQDAPAVSLRAFHLDNARKFFTKDWIL